jgi:hypothetical protein
MTENRARADGRRDGAGIRGYMDACELARMEGIAEQAALKAHPVSRYVVGAPAADATAYPAISETYQSIEEAVTGSARGRRGSRAFSRGGAPYVHWSLPGAGPRGSCGVRRSAHGELPVTVCGSDPSHYAKARAMHCWSLRCPFCFNDAALRMAVKIEARVAAPADIALRKTGVREKMRHWAVSPPQEWLKGSVRGRTISRSSPTT